MLRGETNIAWFPPPQPISIAEIALWSLAIFLLTSPFAFWMMQADPTVAIVRDLSAMRSLATSQWRLYMARGLVLALAMAFSILRWRRAGPAARQMLPFVPFVLWASASLLWSDSFSTSLNSLAAFVALILATFLMGLRLPANVLAQCAIGGGAAVAIFSILNALILPHYGIHQKDDILQSVHAGAWRGVYYHKNHLGQTAAIFAAGMALAGPSIIRSQLLRWGLVGMMLVVIFLSTSASAVVIFPAALALTWLLVILDGKDRLRALLYLIPAGILATLLFNLFLNVLGRDASMTGRTEVWQVAWEWISERPFHGWGYNTLTYGGFSYELLRKRGVIDPHNAFVETVLGTGVIGLALFLIPLIYAWIAARRHQMAGGVEAETALVFSGMTMAWIVASFTEVNARPFSAAGGAGMFALTALIAMPSLSRLAARPRPSRPG